MSGEFVDDEVNEESAFDAPLPLPTKLVCETGLVATIEGDFFISSAKSMPLDAERKLLLPPNSSSNVCILSPLSDRGPDRDHWSSAEKSNGFIVFIGVGTELESGGDGSANDMEAGSLASMLNVCPLGFPNPKSRFIASSDADGDVYVSSSVFNTAGSNGISEPKSNSEPVNGVKKLV